MSSHAVKGLIWYTDGSMTQRGIEAGVYGLSMDRRFSVSRKIYTAVLQAETYVILAYVYEIQTKFKLEQIH